MEPGSVSSSPSSPSTFTSMPSAPLGHSIPFLPHQGKWSERMAGSGTSGGSVMSAVPSFCPHTLTTSMPQRRWYSSMTEGAGGAEHAGPVGECGPNRSVRYPHHHLGFSTAGTLGHGGVPAALGHRGGQCVGAERGHGAHHRSTRRPRTRHALRPFPLVG